MVEARTSCWGSSGAMLEATCGKGKERPKHNNALRFSFSLLCLCQPEPEQKVKLGCQVINYADVASEIGVPPARSLLRKDVSLRRALLVILEPEHYQKDSTKALDIDEATNRCTSWACDQPTWTRTPAHHHTHSTTYTTHVEPLQGMGR